jgi:hypothetical protein
MWLPGPARLLDRRVPNAVTARYPNAEHEDFLIYNSCRIQTEWARWGHDFGDTRRAAGRRRRDWRDPGIARDHPCRERQYRNRSSPSGRGPDRRVRPRNAGPPDPSPAQRRPGTAARTARSPATRTDPDAGARTTGTCPLRAGLGTDTDPAGTHHPHRCPTATGRGRSSTGVGRQQQRRRQRGR